MQAGILKEVITIYKRTEIDSDYGSTFEYLKSFTTRANVEHLGGTKSDINHETNTNYAKRFTVRYYVNIEETDKILWNDNFYQVQTIDKLRDWNQTVVITEKVNE